MGILNAHGNVPEADGVPSDILSKELNQDLAASHLAPRHPNKGNWLDGQLSLIGYCFHAKKPGEPPNSRGAMFNSGPSPTNLDDLQICDWPAKSNPHTTQPP
jgi:hypothetical protein